MNEYSTYNAMNHVVMNGLDTVSGICRQLDMDERASSLETLRGRMNERVFSVGIMGEFKRGKSTVINAMLGQDIVPTDPMPTSATLNYIRWGSRPRAEIHFKTGENRTVEVSELTSYVTKITKENEQMAQTVEDAVVYYPCRFCQDGVQIVDTPGLNDDERMNSISENVIPNLDAIIVVISAMSPFSESEASFIRNKIMVNDLGKVIFVVNMIDLIRPKDRPRIIENITQRIQEKVLDKIQSVYGEDSQEYADARQKTGKLQIFPLSARDALEGKLEGNDEVLRESGFPAFEEELSRVLIEQRGMLQLAAPVRQTMGAANAVVSTVESHRAARTLSAEEFSDAQRETAEEIKRTRDIKQREIQRMAATGQNVYYTMAADLPQAYDRMEEMTLSFIDDYPLSAEDMKKDKAEDTQKRMMEAISARINDALFDEAERLQASINEHVGKTLVSANRMMEEIQVSWEEAAKKSGSVAGGVTSTVVSTIFDVATCTTPLPYIGGIVSGWREHGLSGALLGGAAGMAGGYVAASALAAVLAAPAIPAIAIGSVVASLLGKTAVRLVFGKSGGTSRSAADDLRSRARKGAAETLQNLRGQRLLENWLEEVCQNVNVQLTEQINQEIEMVINDKEKQLASILENLNKSEFEQQAAMKQYEEMLEQVDKVRKDLVPIETRIAELVA